MRPLWLKLKGVRVDLPASIKGLVRLTQARQALSDLNARVGEYSWPATLPATRTNNGFFGTYRLHPVGLDKFQTTDFAYELGCGGEVFTGTFRLTSLKNGYTGKLLGAGFGWAQELGEKKLPELVFPTVAYNGSHLATILALNCDTSDIQFPLLSGGNFFSPPIPTTNPDGTPTGDTAPQPASSVIDYPLSVDDYPPSVYLVNVLRQIFKQAGWYLQGQLLDSAFWRQVCLTPAGADLGNAWPWGALLLASGNQGDDTQSLYSYFDAGPGSGYENNAIGFDESAGVADDTYEISGAIFYLPVMVPAATSPTRAFDGPTASYTAPRAGAYSFAWAATLDSGHQTLTDVGMSPVAIPSFTKVFLGLVVRRGGAGFASADGGLLSGDGTLDATLVPSYERIDSLSGPDYLVFASYSGAATDLYLEAGDVVSLCVFTWRTIGVGGSMVAKREEFVCNFGNTSFACTAYADADGVNLTQLQPASFLPPLLQRDLVRAFLLHTNTVILPDPVRRVASILSREELSQAAGEPLDLSELVDPDAIEYTPSCGEGVGQLVFTHAGADDPLLAADSDTVRAVIGAGAAAQTVESLFAPVAFRQYRRLDFILGGGVFFELPTMATTESLAQSRSEVEWDWSGQAPRLVRYTGTSPTITVPFILGDVPLAQSAWDGVLCWDGEAGAVVTYYATTLRQAVHGHLAKLTAPLTPARYRGLVPGRRVYVFGALYTTEAVDAFDPADEAGATSISLLRTVL
jgi:hypothetical protein